MTTQWENPSPLGQRQNFLKHSAMLSCARMSSYWLQSTYLS